MSAGGFLGRWSKRKLAQAIEAQGRLPEAPAVETDVASAPRPKVVPQAPAAAAADGGVEAALPAVEGLTLASDFTAFLKEEVSESLRRQALAKLFADPHFNRMDGLDIYIDDYSVPTPIPPEMMGKLKHAREWLMDSDAEGEAQERPAGKKEDEVPAAVMEGPVEVPAVDAPDARQDVVPAMPGRKEASEHAPPSAGDGAAA